MKVLRRRSNPSQLATFVYTWRGKLEKWRIDDRKVEFNAAARSRRPVGPARKRLVLSMRRRIGKRTRRWKKKRKRKNTRALDDRSTWTHRRENLFYGLSRNLEIRARLRAKLVRRIAISRVPRNFPPAWNVETFEEEDGQSRGLRTWVAAMAGFTAAEREREREVSRARPAIYHRWHACQTLWWWLVASSRLWCHDRQSWRCRIACSSLAGRLSYLPNSSDKNVCREKMAGGITPWFIMITPGWLFTGQPTGFRTHGE